MQKLKNIYNDVENKFICTNLLGMRKLKTSYYLFLSRQYSTRALNKATVER